MQFLIGELGLNELSRRSLRQNITQLLMASYSMMGSYMVWKLIGLLLDNDSPIVCVLSESMEPGFKRGDILFIRPQGEYKAGDIAVYQVYANAIPIVHRVIRRTGRRVLTMGDNNSVDDVGLYRRGKKFLEAEEVRAGVFGFIPTLGIVTVWINTVPGMKTLIYLYTLWSVFVKRKDTRKGGARGH